MAKPLLDDALWTLIEPLLPPPKPRRRRVPSPRSTAHGVDGSSGFRLVSPFPPVPPFAVYPPWRACSAPSSCKKGALWSALKSAARYRSRLRPLPVRKNHAKDAEK
jgi:transposase